MRDKGFTLIELIIALVVVAILSTIGMVVISNVLQSNKVRATVTEAYNIRNEYFQRFRGSGAVSWTTIFPNCRPVRLNKLPVVGGYYMVGCVACPAGFGMFTGDMCFSLMLRNSVMKPEFIKKVVDEINRRAGINACVRDNTGRGFNCIFPNQ